MTNSERLIVGAAFVLYFIVVLFISSTKAEAVTVISYNLACYDCVPQSYARDSAIVEAIQAENPDVIAFQELTIGSIQEHYLVTSLNEYTYCKGDEGRWEGISAGTFVKGGTCNGIKPVWGAHNCNSVTLRGETILNCHLPWQKQVASVAFDFEQDMILSADYLVGDINAHPSKNPHVYDVIEGWSQAIYLDRVDIIASKSKQMKYKTLGAFGSDHNMIVGRTVINPGALAVILGYLMGETYE